MPLASSFNTTLPWQAGQMTLNVSMKSGVIANSSDSSLSRHQRQFGIRGRTIFIHEVTRNDTKVARTFADFLRAVSCDFVDKIFPSCLRRTGVNQFSARFVSRRLSLTGKSREPPRAVNREP